MLGYWQPNHNHMLTKTITKSAAVTLPLNALKCLYHNASGKKIVCEIDLTILKKLNKPNALDKMVAEARLEYITGKTKTFTSAKALIRELHS